ncbi:MAG: response regulator [Pseudomonadota bacterium]
MNLVPVPILLVDDNPDNLLALTALLEGIDTLELVCVHSGEEALRMLLRREFALVLLDVQMPAMDGYETATLMRANPKTRQVPIVFVTARMGGAECEFRGYESGAVDYLVKPIEPLILHARVRIFAQLYRQKLALALFQEQLDQAETIFAARKLGAPGEPLQLLLVDDRPQNLLALEALLDQLAEVQCVKASSGPEALRAVLNTDFAAILLDVQMPGMSGFETAELIRANPQTSKMPIIFVTAGMKEQAALFKGYELGAVDYLIKPLEPAILCSKIRVFCDLYRQRRLLEREGSYLEEIVAERTAALEHSSAELAESRERYRRLLAAVTQQLFSVQRVGNRFESREHGAGCEAVTGYPPAAFHANPELWLTLVDEAQRGAVLAKVTAALELGQTGQLEHQIRASDGSLRWVRSTFVRSVDALACDVLSENIDQRRRAEHERERVSEQLALATRAAGLGVWDWDFASDTLEWDARCYALCGVARGQLGDAHQTWLACVHPDDRPLCELAMARALRDEQAFGLEFRVRWPDGSVHYLKANGQVVWDEHGKPLRISGVHADVTQRRLEEDELRRHRDHLLDLVDERTASLRAIVDHAADGIVTADEDGRILSFNRAAERMFGYPAQQVTGKDLSVLMPAPHRDAHAGHLRRYLVTGESAIIGVGRELLGQRSDASQFPLYIAVSQIEVGGHKRYTGILRDITAQKAAEASLIAARAAAENANRVKSEFLANMSHELRTPLNAVIGFSQLMLKGPALSAEQRTNLEIIAGSGQHLLTLINDVLELSKIDAGRMQLSEAETDLEGMLGEVVEMLGMRAHQAGLTLALELSGLPAAVRVDAVKLRQVLINLLSNALKFTRHGGVRLEVRASPAPDGAAQLDFAIFDTGIGIAGADLERIFEPFVQVSTHSREGGTGLGLAISRQFVQLLGGELSVASTLGQGSTFRFTLRLALAQAAQAAQAPGRALALPAGEQGRRVLLVDDDPQSRKLLFDLLEPLGFCLEQAGDGIEACQRNAEFAPELIVMDWRMPRRDGLEAIREIRAGSARQPRIVICTASAFEEQCTTALEAGADAFLRKPYREEDLYATLEAQLGLRFERDAAPAAVPHALHDADLAALAAPLRQALTAAVAELNLDRLAELLAEVAEHDPALAEQMRLMTRHFQVRELWALLAGNGETP